MNEYDIGTALFDLFAEPEEILALVPQNAIHGGIIGDDNVVVHVGLGRREAELDHGNFGIGDLGGSPGGLGGALLEDEAVHELGVVNGPADLFDHADVPQVDVGGGVLVLEDPQDGVDRDGREDVRVLADDLGGQTGVDCRNELLAIMQVDGFGDGLQDLGGLVRGLHEGGGDGHGVDALGEEGAAGFEEGAGDDDDGGGAVARLDVLRLGELHEHFGGRVQDVHFGQDGGSVVRDEDFAVGEFH